jgi:choline monooxygenase
MTDRLADERAMLRHEISRFDPTVPVASAKTPPSSWYTSTALGERENETVFQRNWQVVGGADQVAEVGAYLTAKIGPEPVVVVRDEGGVLRGFINVCQHHGARLVDGCGQVKALQCPYHGWTYSLSGALTRAPNVGPIQAFSKGEVGLKTLPVAVWLGLVLVYLGEGDPPELAGPLHPLQRRLEAMGDKASLSFHSRKTYDLACNWKVFIDNYLDGGYHVKTLHPDLASELATEGYHTEVFETFSIQGCRAREEGASGRLGDGALYAFVYPNLMLNRYGPVLDVNVVFPMGPDRCRVVFDYFFDRDAGLSDDWIASCLVRSDQVQREDTEICASVQEGLRSSGYDRGRYAPHLEHAMHHFHCLLARDLS